MTVRSSEKEGGAMIATIVTVFFGGVLAGWGLARIGRRRLKGNERERELGSWRPGNLVKEKESDRFSEEVVEDSSGRRAFFHAYDTLQWLEAEGVTASASLFVDGSGGLRLSPAAFQALPAPLRREIEQRLHSVRWSADGGDVVLSSCQGWYPDAR